MAVSARAREASLVALGSLAFAVLFTYPVWMAWSALPLASDWDGHLQVYGAAAQTVARYHQLPVWNPWECGGSPLLAHPEGHILTPFLLIEALLGVVAGVKVEIVLHLALLVAGGYLLGRELGLDHVAAWAPALVFGWSSTYPLHIGTGHLWALTYAYTPWVLWLAERAVRRRSLLDAGLAGAVLALMANEGGTYPAPHTALVLGVLLGIHALSQRSLWPLGALGLAGVTAVLFAAPHLLPMVALLRGHPRTLESTESTSWSVVFDSFFGLNQDRAQPMPHDRWYWGFHECGAYLGPIAGLLVLVGMVRGGKSAWRWIAVAALMIALGLGDFGDRWAPPPHAPYSFWALLHRLPGFSSQRVPSRFLGMAGPALGVLAGLGLQHLITRWGRRAAVGGAVALALGAADAWARGPSNLRAMYDMPTLTFPESPTFHQFLFHPPGARTQYASMLTLANMGALYCWDEVHLPTKAVGSNQPGYQGEQSLEGDGTVSLLRWTPNELRYHVDAPSGGTLVVNENYDAPWSVTEGQGEVISADGRIGVRVPPGPEDLTIAYRSGYVTAGFALFALGCAGLVGLGYIDRRSRSAAAPVATS